VQHCSDTVFVTGRTTNDTTPATSPSAAPSSSSTVDLDTGIKLGIGIAAGVLIVALLIVAIEACYLRKKRRERGLQRAIDEVEIGVHKGSEERMVLESRVSIIVEDEGQEEQEEDEAEVERGRNGMSLPRRD
jgi:flagellar biosynthesis/type III secretory pathway M-ring protein FliF/YscJ